MEGSGEVSIRDLIRTALRMRPDRIIVGEVRGAETIDMLQAMNTGHDGSLSTGHGNSVSDMLDRLETMVLLGTDIPLMAVRKQIASAIDIMVQLGRLRDGRRCVLEISEILSSAAFAPNFCSALAIAAFKFFSTTLAAKYGIYFSMRVASTAVLPLTRSITRLIFLAGIFISVCFAVACCISFNPYTYLRLATLSPA